MPNKIIKTFITGAALCVAQSAGAWGAVWELAPVRGAESWVREDTSRIYSATYNGMRIPLAQGVTANQPRRDGAIESAKSICERAKREIRDINRRNGGINETLHCTVRHIFQNQCVGIASMHQGYKIKAPNKFLAALGDKRRIYTASYIGRVWSGEGKVNNWYKKNVRDRAQKWCDAPRSVPAIPGQNKGLVQECHIANVCDWEARSEGRPGVRMRLNGTNLCVHPKGGRDSKVKNNTKLVFHSDSCADHGRTVLAFELESSGALKHLNSGKCVHPKGGHSRPGNNTELVLHDGCSASYAKWELRNGSLYHKSSGKCVHPKGGRAKNETPLVLWDSDCGRHRFDFHANRSHSGG